MNRISKLTLLAGLVFALIQPLPLSAALEIRSNPETSFEDALKDMNHGEYDVAVVRLKTLLQENQEDIPARILLGKAYLRQGYASSAEKQFRLALYYGADEDNIFVPLGNSLLVQRKYEEILRDIKNNNPGQFEKVEVLVLRGRASYELGRIDEATQLFDRAIEVAPSEVEPLFGRAEIATANAEWETALSYVDNALRINPNSAEAWFRKATILGGQGELGEAKTAYDRCLTLNPDHLRGRLGRATLSLGRNDLETAIADALFVDEKTQADVTAAFILWQAYLRRDEIELAGDAFEKVKNRLTETPQEVLFRSASLLRVAGLIAFAEKDYERANNYLSKLVEINRHDYAVAKTLAQIKLQLKAYEQARDLLFPLRKKFPNDAKIAALLGEAYLNLHRYDSAAHEFAAADALAPNNAPISSRLILSDVGAGRTSHALRELEKDLDERLPSRSDTVLLVTLLVKQGGYDKALATLNDLDHRQPNSAFIQNLKGVVLLAKNQRELAREAFTKALSLEPRFTPAIHNLGQMHIERQEYALAYSRFKEMVTINPRSAPALIGLAEAAEANGNLIEAQDALSKAIAIDGTNMKAHVRLIELFLVNDQPIEAKRAAENFTAAFPNAMESYEMVARVNIALRDLENAKLGYRRAKQAAGYEAAALLRIADGQTDIGDYSGARSTLIKALNSDRKIAATAALVRLDLRTGNILSAKEYATNIQTENPDQAIGHILMAETQAAAADFNAALVSYDRAVALTNDSEPILGRGKLLFHLGRQEEAINSIKAWLHHNPSNPYVTRELAMFQIRAGDLDSARLTLEKLVQSSGEIDPKSLSALARIYQLQSDPRARQLAQKAFDLDPNWAVTSDTLGWILVTEGDVESGLKLLRQAFARESSPEIRFHIASALKALGRYDEARQEAEIILNKYTGLTWLDDVRQFADSLK